MSETETVTLADFLLARIAEDEASARDSLDEGWTFGVTADLDLDAWQWQARRDLAECAAKRRIVEGCGIVTTGLRNMGDEYESWVVAVENATLRPLASIYADHPEFPHDRGSVV